MMNPFLSLPVLATVLFYIGLLVVLFRKNTIMILIGLELMLNSANLNLMAFSSYRADAQGQLLIIVILIVAVCEAAVGLAIFLRVYKFYHTSIPENISEIKERNS
jgi:NADH:ubiquinone oxidoreductase subunit K